MRSRLGPATILAGLLPCLLSLLLSPGAAVGEEPDVPKRLRLALGSLPALEVGKRATLEVRLFFPGEESRPLLLTASAEGVAVDVVRGRMMRGDAEDPAGSPLVFRVPLVARAAGTSVLRVRVDGYVCRPGCQAAAANATLSVEVRATGGHPGAPVTSVLR